MILGLIFSILTATYSISTTTTVEASGDIPTGSTYSYQRSATTGQKGQMTAGNSTLLTLDGWDAITIDSVVLEMRSNKSAGAGSLTMHIGEKAVWAIADADFSHKTWNNSFTTDWVKLSKTLNATVGREESIEIYIEASKNSLYINSYTLYYSLPDPEAYEVGFVSGLSESPNTIAETSVGSGIVLPAGRDTLYWHFVGWSEKEVLDETECPHVYQAGERYFPKSDCTLWAVYSEGDGILATKDYISGDYAIVSAAWNVALAGGVTGHEIATTPIAIDTTENGDYQLLTGVEDNMIYHIDFMEDSTVYIQHYSSESMIGYTATRLAENESAWSCKYLEDGSCCFYYNDNATQRMLYVGYNLNSDHDWLVGYVVPVKLSLMQKDGFLLFPATEIHFTSWPFGKLDGIKDVLYEEKQATEYTWRIGNYVLQIRNGKKYLHLCQ